MSNTSVVYQDIPAQLPEGMLVLEVEFTQHVQDPALNQPPLERAHVRRVVRGDDFRGGSVLVTFGASSCTYPPHPGARGYIIGELTELAGVGTVFLANQESRRERLARTGTD